MPDRSRPSAPKACVTRSALPATLLAVALLPGSLAAQLDLTGYALGMASGTRGSALVPEGATVLARARLMTQPAIGALTFDVAYEHIVTRSPSGPTLGLTTPGVQGGGTDWLEADWEIWSDDRASWRARFDRIAVGYEGEDFSVTVGRQAISWANTLFLTPADPFVPFDPSDPFRVYRAGVDAGRLRYFPGAFTELEVVVRPEKHTTGASSTTEATVLARAQTSTAGWAWGGWAGAVRGDASGALFATGSFGATAVRSELSLRTVDERAELRAALGLDRYFTPGSRDLYVVVEAQYDGFGVTDVADLLSGVGPLPAGERQVLGRWTWAAQASLQLHPLVGVDGLVLLNGSDGSALFAPGASWSATGSASVRGGLFVGAGAGAEAVNAFPTAIVIPRSEYGSVPAIAYLSLTWFF